MEIQKIENQTVDDGDFRPSKAIFIIIVFLLIITGLWVFFSGSGKGGTSNTPTTSIAGKNTPPGNSITIDPAKSFYNGWVKISDTSATAENYPQREFIQITVIQKNLSSVDVSKWMLVNQKGEGVALGQVSMLPSFGKVNPTVPLKINGGDVLTVSSGASPIGVSFRMNRCLPYFEQFNDFIPPIQADNCPFPTNNKAFQSVDGACQNFANNIPMCQTFADKLPASVGSACKTFIDNHASYRGCVSEYQDNSGFYTNEWRIFLNKDHQMWASGDTITLIDGDRKTIDSVGI